MIRRGHLTQNFILTVKKQEICRELEKRKMEKYTIKGSLQEGIRSDTKNFKMDRKCRVESKVERIIHKSGILNFH